MQLEHPVRRQEAHHSAAVVLHTQCGLANDDHFTRAAGAVLSQCSYSDEKVFGIARGRAVERLIQTAAVPNRASKTSCDKSNERRPENLELTVWGNVWDDAQL